MIIQIGTEVDESRILWKHKESDEWKRADIDDLIRAYENRPRGKWENSEDCISRQEVLDLVSYWLSGGEDGDILERIDNLPSVMPDFETFCGVPIKEAIEVLEKHKHSPSVTPTVKVQQTDTLIIATALQDLAQNSKRNISDRERAEELREQVLAYGASMCTPVTPTDKVVDFNNMISGGGRIRNLPPVTPTERTGEWIEVEKSEHGGLSIVSMRCNQCRRYAYLVLPKGTKCVYDYCPWCKADMRGDTE